MQQGGVLDEEPADAGTVTLGLFGMTCAACARRIETVLNRVEGAIPDILDKIIEEQGLDLFFSIPEDDILLKMDQSGKPIWKIAEDSLAYQAVHQMMSELVERK